MILVTQDADPKSHETKLKLKNPTSPQLIAPIRLTVRAVQSNALFPMDITSYSYFLCPMILFTKGGNFIHISLRQWYCHSMRQLLPCLKGAHGGAHEPASPQDEEAAL